MKKFKKTIVALLAMTMALGMLTVAAKADGDTYTDGGKLYFVGASTDWGFAEMTGSNGVYTYEVELTAGTTEYKFTLQDSWADEINPGGSQAGGNFSYEVPADGKYVFTVDTSKVVAGEDATHWDGTDAVTVAAAADTSTGVSAPVVVAAIAVVSMVGIVVFAKRRTVAE